MARIVPPIAKRAKRITSGAGLDGMLARSVAKIKKNSAEVTFVVLM